MNLMMVILRFLPILCGVMAVANSEKRQSSCRLELSNKPNTAEIKNCDYITVDSTLLSHDDALSINYMEIIANKISTIKSAAFKNMHNLETIHMRDNKLMELPVNTFQGLRKTTSIVIESSDLIYFYSGSFNDLRSVAELYLSDNIIRSLPSHGFKGLINLQYLDLRKNNIATIDVGAFEGLSNLKKLWMPLNNIEFLSALVFDPLKNLESLSLGSCSIHTIWNKFKLPRLKYLLLNDNQLMKVNGNLFKHSRNIVSIDFSKNRLGRITANPFKNLDRLVSLNLANNNLLSTTGKTLQRELANVKVSY